MRYCSLLVLIAMLPLFSACKSSPEDQKRASTLHKISSDSWAEREKGVFELHGMKIASEEKHLLLNTLRKESQVVESSTVRPSDNEYNDYVIALSNLVATNKISAGLPLLFDLIRSGKIDLSPAVLLYYGEPAFDFLNEKAKSGLIAEREIALAALAIWVEPQSDSYAEDYDPTIIKPLSDSQKGEVMHLMLDASNSDDYNIRSMSLEGLGSFLSDDRARERLEAIAEKDNKIFIRNRAREILRQAETKK